MDDKNQPLLLSRDESYSGYSQPVTFVEAPKTFPAIVVFVFIVNLTIGAGILGIPKAFGTAGLVLGIVVLALVTFMSIISGSWLVEVQGRMHALETAKEARGPTSLEMSQAFFEPVIGNTTPFELTTLAERFLGKASRLIWELLLIVYSYGAMWAYTVMFSSAMTARVPLPWVAHSSTCNIYQSPIHSECEMAYYIYIVLFAAIMIPLSLCDLQGQIKVQLCLTAFAFLAMTTMVVTVAISMMDHCFDGNCNVTHAPYIQKSISLVDFTGFGPMFSTCLFAQICHHGIPGITSMARDKKVVPGVLAFALSTTCVFYMVLAITCALYFGPDNLQKIITLNWDTYTDTKFSSGNVPWFVTAIKWLVLLFPAITTMAAYPLYAVTLGSNLQGTIAKPLGIDVRSTILKNCCRLGAVIPPFAMAAAMWNVTSILTFTGTTGIFIAYVYPALLQYFSKKACTEVWGTQAGATPYSKFYSENYFVFGFLVVSAISFVFVLVTAIIEFV